MSTPNEAATLERVAAAVPGLPEGATGTDHDGMVTVTATPDTLHDVCRALRDQAGFETNTLVTARDHGAGRPQRYELFYQFLSYAHGDRVRVRVLTEGEDPSVPTITDLWPGTSFSERECYDMFGVRFDGHPDLRRLLMPEGYDHFPLRKDFPHVGIQPDKLYREWDAERRAEYEAAEKARTEGQA